jgi:hypothetical protein
VIWAYVLGAVLLLGGGASSSWWFTSEHYQKLALEAERDARKQVDEANQKAINAEADWQVWAELQRPANVKNQRDLEHAIKTDLDCSARAVPASVRDPLIAAGADAHQPGVAGPVPAPSAAGTFDLGGLGARLSGDAAGAPRLRGSPQGPR